MKEKIAEIINFIEFEAECVMPITVPQTKKDYGIALLKSLCEELREKFLEQKECKHDWSDGCSTGWYVCKLCGDMF